MIGFAIGGAVMAAVRKVTRDIERVTRLKRKNRPAPKALPAEEKLPFLIRQLALTRSNKRRQKLTASELRAITGRDFGVDVAAWNDWYEENADCSRADWCTDAVEDGGYNLRGLPLGKLVPQCVRALRSGNKGVRAGAHYLLRHYTGQKIPFPVSASAETRTSHYRRWARWWNTEGAAFVRENKVM